MKLDNEKLTSVVIAVIIFVTVFVGFILLQQSKIQSLEEEIQIQQIQVSEVYKSQEALQTKVKNLWMKVGIVESKINK